MSLIERVDQKLNNWIELTNKTVNEYYETKYYGRAVVQLTPAEITNIKYEKLVLNLAIAFVIGLMVSIFIVFFREYWRKGSNSSSQTLAG